MKNCSKIPAEHYFFKIINYPKPQTTFRMEIVNVYDSAQMNEVKGLVWEYFNWGNSISIVKNGFEFDISKMLDDFLNDRESYVRPHGMLYLLRSGEDAVGIGGFKKIKEKTCELKRVYVKETYRKTGFGTKLLETLISDAKNSGFTEMQLESARFMEDAFRLYQKFGFKEIPIYSEVESPQHYQSTTYCMQLQL
jgi:GNAT superfamily N-acetyltransferase